MSMHRVREFLNWLFTPSPDAWEYRSFLDIDMLF